MHAQRQGVVLPKRAPRYGLLLIQLELALMYFQTMWHKSADVSWRTGELASYFFMGTYSIIQKPLLIDLPRLSVFLTHLALLIEISVPFLLWNNKWRIFGFVGGYSLHFVIFFSEVPIFSLVCMISYWAFVSGDDLDRLHRFLNRHFGWYRRRFSESV